MDSKGLDVKSIKPFLSIPKPISFPGKYGICYGYFYPPTNLSGELGKKFMPPLVVRAHGGPTAQASRIFRLDIQYWTSRGFAVLDVNYGGSTGFGRHYRLRLYCKLGIQDMNDCCSAAQWCVNKDLVNRSWLCIHGINKGGYATLCALTFRDVFSVGALEYGISDLATLHLNTHKFESQYMDSLTGNEKETYDERNPINFTQKLNCPIILLQGDEDKGVSLNEAEIIYEKLKEKAIFTTLVIYKGEQYGFRKRKNICHSLSSQYEFFCKVLGIQPLKEIGFLGIEIGERIEI